ncbi:MAG: hypothetical protein U9Q82_06020 [Chloroflexota bacterium]|nr:hypothetical protein [Chloroflexota bacterium]
MTYKCVISLFLYVWLTAETIQDFRDRRIPLWFSIVPLSLGLIVFLLYRSMGAATLMAVSIAATNLTQSTLRRILTILPLAGVAMLGYVPLAVGWLLFYMVWELGAMGAADALAGAYLLIWFPTWIMLASIVTGVLLWNLGALLLRYGCEAGLRLWTTIANRAKPTRVPSIGAFLIALPLFVLWSIR